MKIILISLGHPPQPWVILILLNSSQGQRPFDKLYMIWGQGQWPLEDESVWEVDETYVHFLWRRV